VFPVFVGTAKVEIFLYLSSFLFFIFLEWLNSLKLKQTLTGSYFLHVFQNLFSHPSHCFPSSEAGCKSRKKYHHTKQLYQLICIKGVITCFSSIKNTGELLYLFSDVG
jgi:hypothetical protein